MTINVNQSKMSTGEAETENSINLLYVLCRCDPARDGVPQRSHVRLHCARLSTKVYRQELDAATHRSEAHHRPRRGSLLNTMIMVEGISDTDMLGLTLMFTVGNAPTVL